MAPLKCIKRHANEEPPSCPVEKLRRLHVSSPTGGPEIQPWLNFNDLPNELIQMIFGHVNIWHFNRLRATTRRFRDLVDDFVVRHFEKELRRCTYSDPNGSQCATLETIKQATELYVEMGHELVFAGCLLPMLRSAYKDPFNPSIKKVVSFLIHFFNRVDKSIASRRFECSELLHALTLLKLLKLFSKKTIVSFNSNPRHWQTVIEIEGPWFGNLYPSSVQNDNPKKLLVLLAEMLIADKTGTSFKRVAECYDELYVFGNETSSGKRIPKTVFTLKVDGSHHICALFQSFLEEENVTVICPKLQREPFTVNLEITCKEATKWGCSKTQLMEF